MKSNFVLALLATALFLGVAENQAIPILLPLLSKEFHVSPGELGTTVTTYAIAAAAASLVVGRLSDTYGRPLFLTAALFLFGASALLIFFSTGAWEVLSLRTMAGLAAGTLSTTSISFAGDFFPYQRRGFAMGVIGTAYFAASTVGVWLASILASEFGWRTIYVVLSGGAFAVAVFCWSILRKQETPQTSPGSVLQVFPRFFRNRSTLCGLIAAFIFSGGLVGYLTYLGAWLSSTWHFTSKQTGMLFLAGGSAAILFSPLAGKLGDRWTKKTVILIGNTVMAIVALAIPSLHWVAVLFALFALASIGEAFRLGSLQALSTEISGSANRGAYIAARNTASQLGIAIVTLLCGWLYDRWGYTGVAILVALLTISATFAILLIEEPHGSTVST